MNQQGTVRVEIFGNEYFVKAGDEVEIEHVKELAKYVDKKMREVATTTSVVSTAKVAILAALNIADELFSLRKEQKDFALKDVEGKLDRLARILDEVTVK